MNWAEDIGKGIIKQVEVKIGNGDNHPITSEPNEFLEMYEELRNSRPIKPLKEKIETNKINNSIPTNYTWILTADLTGIDEDDIPKYSCYDDRCLISTYFKDDILDYLEYLKIKVITYILTLDYEYEIRIEMDESNEEEMILNLMKFKIGRFTSTSVNKI